MRCVAVLSTLPDVLYFDADAEYIRALNVYSNNHGIPTSIPGNGMSGVNLDAVQMQFLPMFSSLDMLQSVDAELRSFTTDSGHTVVIRKYDDHLFLGLSSEDSEHFLAGQLALLHNLLVLQYGPVLSMVKPGNISLRAERWGSIARLMASVTRQRREEQAGLVMSMEHIRLNKHVKRACVDALEMILSDKDSRREKTKTGFGTHALLLAGDKMLAQYSKPNAPELSSGDLFLITLFVQNTLGVRTSQLADSTPPTSAMTTPAQTPVLERTMSSMGSMGNGFSTPTEREERDRVIIRRSSSVKDGVERFYSAREALSPIPSIAESEPASHHSHPSTAASVYDSPSASRTMSPTHMPSLPATPMASLPSDMSEHAQHQQSTPRVSQHPSAADLSNVNLPDFEGLDDARTPEPAALDGDGDGEGGLAGLAALEDRLSMMDMHAETSSIAYTDSADTLSISDIVSQGAPEGSSRSGASYDGDVSQGTEHAGRAWGAHEDSGAGVEGGTELRAELRREPVFLETGANKCAPYILHCTPVTPGITLVILSQGRHSALSEVMGTALTCASNIISMGAVAQRRIRAHDTEVEIPKRSHMAVRGATGQAAAHTHINGNYIACPQLHDDREAYERTSKDAYLFYSKLFNAWCISEELGDTSPSACVAMCGDMADDPALITNTWEVYDFDLRVFRSDRDLSIRCVRGDGALRNRSGAWATQSSNGKYYCGGYAVCTCGSCNQKCGPIDGCNCTSCRELDGSQGYGNLELAITVKLEAENSRKVAAEEDKRLKKETEILASSVKKILQAGGKLVNKALENSLVRYLTRLLEALKKDERRKWQLVTDLAESISKTLRACIGEGITKSNQVGSKQEEELVRDMRSRVCSSLADYTDFINIKIQRNITMSAYIEMFPGLVHFIYVDRTRDNVIAPCLTPAPAEPMMSSRASSPSAASSSARHEYGFAHVRTLKEQVWELHDIAQQRLAEGYTSLSYQHGDFRCSYLLWFEDTNALRVSPSQAFADAFFASTTHVGSKFYKEMGAALFSEAVSCYELYMVHMSVVPFDYAIGQGQALVHQLRTNTEG